MNAHEFYGFLSAIRANSDFRRLRTIRHHEKSVYHHAIRVAWVAYRMGSRINARYRHLDLRSLCRGALLHDFFLYDWHTEVLPDGKLHGFEHPRIALENASRIHPLNNVERDIILKHMWPLTLSPPAYPESFIVCLADKLVATQDYGRRTAERLRRFATRLREQARDYFARPLFTARPH